MSRKKWLPSWVNLWVVDKNEMLSRKTVNLINGSLWVILFGLRVDIKNIAKKT